MMGWGRQSVVLERQDETMSMPSAYNEAMLDAT